MAENIWLICFSQYVLAVSTPCFIPTAAALALACRLQALGAAKYWTVDGIIAAQLVLRLVIALDHRCNA